MTQEEAEQVITLLRAATGGRVDDGTVDYFAAQFLSLDYDIALTAATTGSTLWRFFPSWAEFKEVYKAQERHLAPAEENPLNFPDGKRGVAPPEWVSVWWWSRQMRSPRCLIPFPQQEFPESESQLSMNEYEKLREEWVAAGKPKPKNLLPSVRSMD